MIKLDRRKFLSAIGSIIASPAVVRASELMPIRAQAPLVSFASFGMNDGDTQASVEILEVLRNAYPAYEIKLLNRAIGSRIRTQNFLRAMPAMIVLPAEKEVWFRHSL